MRYGGRTPLPAALIGVWDDNGHSFVRTFGYADLQQSAADDSDHFRIGSNTKTFVVGVLLQLVAERKLTLDDPLSRFSARRHHSQRREHYGARTLRHAQRTLRSLRYAAVRRAELEGAEEFNPQHARRLGRAAQAVLSRPIKATATATPTTFCSG